METEQPIATVSYGQSRVLIGHSWSMEAHMEKIE
jgi:hypothetical protein